MRIKLSNILFLAPALGLLAGCMKVSESAQSATRYVITGHAGGAYEPQNVQKYDLEGSSRLVLLSRGVQRSVTCPSLQERRLDDGRLEIIANLRNRQERRIEIQVDCVFKDANGFPTNDESPARIVFLAENATEGVRFVSLNAEAQTYTIRVMESR